MQHSEMAAWQREMLDVAQASLDAARASEYPPRVIAAGLALALGRALATAGMTPEEVTDVTELGRREST